MAEVRHEPSVGGARWWVKPIRIGLWAGLRLVARKVCSPDFPSHSATRCGALPPEEPERCERALCCFPGAWTGRGGKRGRRTARASFAVVSAARLPKTPHTCLLSARLRPRRAHGPRGRSWASGFGFPRARRLKKTRILFFDVVTPADCAQEAFSGSRPVTVGSGTPHSGLLSKSVALRWTLIPGRGRERLSTSEGLAFS